MSIAVELADLAAEAAQRPFAYLMTSRADGRPHAVAVVPTFEGAQMYTEAGRSTCANAVERPLVSLIWPPTEAGGYSLIVDADASVEGERITLTPTRAVLHRPAAPEVRAAAASDGGCGADCAPVALS